MNFGFRIVKITANCIASGKESGYFFGVGETKKKSGQMK
jgi:hypothetical protein